MIDTDGLSAYVEKCIAYTSHVLEQSKLAKASLIEMRGATADLANLAPRSRIYLYWRKEWPKGKYPTADDWTLLRGEIQTGGMVFAHVGANAPTTWVRLISLSDEPEPKSAEWIQMQDSEMSTRAQLCPAFGANPKNAIWEARVFSTRTGA